MEGTEKGVWRETLRLSIRGWKIWWTDNPRLLIATVANALIGSLIPFAGIRLLAGLLNEVSGAYRPHVLFYRALALLMQTAVLTALGALLKRWRNAEWDGVWHMQNRIIMRKLLSMEYASVSNFQVQELRSRIWQNSNSGAWGLYRLLFVCEEMAGTVGTISGAAVLCAPMFWRKVPETVGGLIILNHPVFLLFFLTALPASALLASFFRVRADSWWVRLSEEHKMGNRLFAFWMEEVGSDRSKALDVRIYRQDILSRSQLEHYNPFRADTALAKAARGPMGGMRALAQAIAIMYPLLVFVFICLKAAGGAFGVGEVTQYMSSAMLLSEGMAALFSAGGNLKNNASFLRQVFEFLDYQSRKEPGSLLLPKEEWESFVIEFRNVSFRYPGQKRYALRNVSCTLRSGQRFAVVGENGSGKTTFIKLLCGLLDPAEGEILFNGTDIRSFREQEYFSLFSVVFQDFRLLSFELGQNVAAGVRYDRSRAEYCLRKVGFGERLDGLEDGLATMLYRDFDEKGISVSGGEAQKIALARALYKKSAFLVLDEPTAALDPVAEAQIYADMREMAGEKTALFVSHRLSSCRFCENIMVFHEGRLIQSGSHEMLVADETGKYYELWNAQAQYYEEK